MDQHMNLGIDEQSSYSLNAGVRNTSSSVWLRLYTDLTEFCFEVFSCMISKLKYPAMKYQFIMKLAILFIRTLQIFSLLIDFDVPLKLKDVSGFWKVICIFRVDYAFYLLDALLVWIVISITIPGLAFLLLIILKIKKMKGHSLEESKFLSLFEIMLNVSTSVLYLPIIYTLIENTVNGFYSNPNPRISTVPIYLSVICMIFLIIHIFFVFLRSLLYSQTDHSLHKKSLDSRASGSLLLVYNFLLIVQAALQIYLLPLKPAIFYMISIISWSTMAWLFNKKLPFYSSRMNALMISSCLAVVTMSLTIVLSWLLDTPSVPLLLCIFFLPLFTASSFHYISSQYKFKLLEYQESLVDMKLEYEYELGIRMNLLYNNSEVLDTFMYIRQNPYIKRNKIFYVWQTYYCLSEGMDGLARIILSKGIISESSLEADFFEYHCRKILNSKENTEAVRYLAFQEEISDVKTLDEELCFLLCDFWEELLQPKPIPIKIANLLFSSQKLIDKLKKQYKHLLQKHTRSTHIMKLYGSFLAQVINYKDRGEQLIIRAEEEKLIRARNRRASEKYLSFFDEELGIMMISGAPDNEGIISYANSRASEITGYSLQTLHGSNISTIIPPSFGIHHTNFMKSYLNDLKTDTLNHPSTMFFYTQSCKIISVNVNLKVTALSSFPMFMLAFSVKKNYPDVALLREDGLIECHTSNLPFYLGLKSSILIGTKIQDHIPFPLSSKTPFRPFKISTSESIYCMFAYSQFRTRKLDLFLVLKGEKEFEKWRSSQANQEKDNLLLNYDHQTTYKNFKITDEEEKDENPTFDTLEATRMLAEERRLSSIVTFGTMPEIHTYKRSGLPTFSVEAENSETQGLTKDLTFSSESIPKLTRSDSRTLTSSAFTSFVSNFNTSSTSYISREHKKLNYIFISLKLYKYLFLFTVLISITSVGVTGVVFYIIADNSIEESVIDILGEKLYLISELGHDARVLDLNARGYIVDDQPDQLLLEMTTVINRLHEIEKHLENKYSDWRDGEFKSMYTQNVVPIYTLENGVPKMKKTNLFDMTQKMIASGRIVVDRGSRNMLNDTDTYFLYRNGLGEAAEAANSSLIKFMEYQIEDIDIIGIESFVCIGTVVLILIICVVVVLPKLQMIKYQTSVLWRDIYRVNKAIVLECRSKLVDRLLIVHLLERETERLDKKYADIDVDRLDIPYKPWRSLINILAIFIVITIGFCILLYFLVIDMSTLLMKLRPELYEITARDMVNMQGVWGWMKENNLYNTSASVFLSDPVMSHNGDPFHKLDDTIINLYQITERVEALLRQGGIQLKTSHFDLLYRELDSTSLILRKGLTAGFNAYSMECQILSHEPWSPSSNVLIQSYRLIDREIIQFKKKSIKEYHNSFDDYIKDRRNWSVVIVSIYGTFGILYYIIVFTKGLNKAIRKIKRVLKTAMRVKAYEAMGSN